MSKKEARRAARQAFPPAKNPQSTRPRYHTRATRARNPKSRASARQGLRPPTLKRAAIQRVIGAALYFVLIEWLWNSGASTGVNLLFSAVGFAIFTGVAYWTDRFKYQRALRKSKGQSK